MLALLLLLAGNLRYLAQFDRKCKGEPKRNILPRADTDDGGFVQLRGRYGHVCFQRIQKVLVVTTVDVIWILRKWDVQCSGIDPSLQSQLIYTLSGAAYDLARKTRCQCKLDS